MRSTWSALLVAIVASVTGCAVVPPESVQLSSLVGQDLLAIKQSHVFYVNSFYDRVEFQANRAIDNEFTPALIAAELRGPAGQILFADLAKGKEGGVDAGRALDILGRFLEKTHEKIDEERKRVLTPIQTARTASLSQVESAYNNVTQANATVTAYLSSLQKLRKSQDELLATASVPNLQNDVAQTLAHTSDQIDSILTKARRGEATVDDTTGELRKLVSGK
jgi:hypothetical protein